MAFPIRFRKILSIATLAALPVVTFAQKPLAFTVDGVQRHAIVFAPASNTAPAPLIFAFHGHGGNAQAFAQGGALQTHWPEAIIVYPQGLPTVGDQDPQGKQPGWQHSIGESNDRDLKFVDAMIASLKSQYKVDTNRVYTVGFSNGAMFSYLLWVARPNDFAAIGAVAGKFWPGVALPTTPKPILHIAGKADARVKFADQEETVAQAVKIDGAGNATPCGANCSFYQGKNGNNVRFVTHPGGHVYPPFASDVIVKFFQNHPHVSGN